MACVKPIVLLLLVLQNFVKPEELKPEEKSLFDELPLNGAYSPATSHIKLVKPSIQSLDVHVAVRNSHETAAGRDLAEPDEIAESGANPNALGQLIDEITYEDENSKDNSIGTDTFENSLFDKLPNKGAMNEKMEDERQSSNPNVPSGTQKRSFLSSRGSSSSVFYSDNNVQYGHSVTKASTLPPATEFKVHSADGAIPVITSTGVRVPLLVTQRQGHANVYDARPSSPEFNKVALMIPNQSYRVPPPLFPPPPSSGPAGPIPVVRSNQNNEFNHHYYPKRTENQRPHHFRQPFQPQPPSPSRFYGPPQQNQPSGGYQPPTQTTITQPPSSATDTAFPIVIGTSTSSSVVDYDLDHLQDGTTRSFQPRTGSFQFSSGTGSGLGVPSKYDTPPPPYSYAYSNPATSWDDVRPSYGPPSHQPAPPIHDITSPAPTYGPPEVHPPAPPPQSPPKPPASTSVTSISYQTIPVQTVHTELVTVPHITVSSSSVSESETSQDTPFERPEKPTRPVYGAPSITTADSSQYNNRQGQGPTKRSGSLFTDEQLAALLAFSQGQSQSELITPAPYTDEELALGLLAGGQARGVNWGLGLDAGNIGLGTGLTSPDLQSGSSFLGQIGRPRGFRSSSYPLRFLNPFRTSVRNRNAENLLTQQMYSNAYGQNLGTRFALTTDGGFNGGSGRTILTKGAVQAVNDLVQEQRLRNSVADLRTRLELEGQNTERARDNYRNLFYRGALLLSALTLIPMMVSPAMAAMASSSSAFATGAGAGFAGAGAAAAGSPVQQLLPLAFGRKRRDTKSLGLEDYTSFQNCTTVLQEFGFGNWLDCAENATMKMFEDPVNEASSVTSDNNSSSSNGSSSSSLFDTMAFKGAMVPTSIRSSLLKYLPAEELQKNSECIQKRFCETLKEIKVLPNAETFLSIYSTFAGDLDSNPWIREAMTAGRNGNCEAFFCFQDYENVKK